MELPDGTTPIASKVVLYSNSETWQQARVPPLPKILAEHNASNSTKYGKLGKREAESVIAKPTKGITLLFPINANSLDTDTKDKGKSANITHSSSNSNSTGMTTATATVTINLHTTTVQDILADLGKPSRIFYKEEDKMKIHSVTSDHHSMLNNNTSTSSSHHSNHPLELKSGDTTTAGSSNVDDKDKGKQTSISVRYTESANFLNEKIPR
jgi:hypothetical protein